MRMRFKGRYALWTHPASRSERSTQTMGSHEAWRNVLRRILGKWSVEYTISQVDILKRGKKVAMTSNELKFDNVGIYPVDLREQKNRTQRTSVFLQDVDYVVHFTIGLSHRAGPEDNEQKFKAMFHRRAKNGQQERAPYLGIRECSTDWELIEDDTFSPTPEPFDEDLGISFFGTDWVNDRNYFYPLTITQGVLRYPSWDEVQAYGLSRPKRKVS